ncbi:hypothetical protein CF319_g9661, partial [Tilletia indica]
PGPWTVFMRSPIPPAGPSNRSRPPCSVQRLYRRQQVDFCSLLVRSSSAGRIRVFRPKPRSARSSNDAHRSVPLHDCWAVTRLALSTLLIAPTPVLRIPATRITCLFSGAVLPLLRQGARCCGG